MRAVLLVLIAAMWIFILMMLIGIATVYYQRFKNRR